MSCQHKSLAAGRWGKIPFLEQMANIGSEVERSLNWQEKNNMDYAGQAAVRAIELLDLTLDNIKGFPRLKEIARIREIVADYFFGGNLFHSAGTQLRKYFQHFTYAARRNS